MRDDESTTDARALRHPLFWVALALLVANDHLLKGAGVLPGWLTGKLSDFAGLLVAPVLLSALLRARDGRRRGIAFASIALWFAAVKLVPAAAALSTEIAATIGLRWAIVPDPTDLVALSILPLAWHVAANRGRLAPRVWTERLAIGLGVAACIASPAPDPAWSTEAFLVNRTTETIDVRVRWVDARVDCSAIRDRFHEILSRDVFTAGTLYTLDPDHTLPLDRGLANATDPFAEPEETGHVGTCDVALISIDGIPDQMVFWDGLVVQSVLEADPRHRVEGGLTVRANADGSLRLDSSTGYVLAPPTDLVADGACHDYGQISGYDWSELPAWSGQRITLSDVHEGIDGCMSLLAHDDETGLDQRAYVCVPAADFPFASGDEVQVWNGEHELRIARDLVRGDGSLWRVGELVVHRGTPDFREGPFAVSVVQADDACGGVRMDCGGFRVPSAGGIQLTDGTRFVNPGEVMERDAADGRRARLRVGRAETLWVTRDACGAGRDQLGSRLEALVVYGEEKQ